MLLHCLACCLPLCTASSFLRCAATLLPVLSWQARAIVKYGGLWAGRPFLLNGLRLCPAHQQLLHLVRSCTSGAESQKQLMPTRLGLAWAVSKARTVIPIPAILQLRRSSDKSVPQMVMPLWCAVLADRGPSGTSDDLSSLQMSSAPLPCAPAAATFRSQLHNGR